MIGTVANAINSLIWSTPKPAQLDGATEVQSSQMLEVDITLFAQIAGGDGADQLPKGSWAL